MNDPIRMYLLVNSDLGMGKGKIAGQCGHAVQYLIEELVVRPIPAYTHWRENGAAKIVYKAPQHVLEMLLKKYPEAVAVRDAGLTQIAPNSLTVIGFPPVKESRRPVEFANLKLL